MHTLVYTQIKGNLGNFNSEAKSVWKKDVHHDNMLKEHFNEPKTILSKLTIFPTNMGRVPVNSQKLFSHKYFLP